MQTLHVNIPVAPLHEGSEIRIADKAVEISIPLTNGSHTIETEPTEIGTFSGSTLNATFTLTYQYDEAQNMITFCGNDFESSEAPCIYTICDSNPQSLLRHTSLGNNAGLLSDQPWNQFIGDTPELNTAFKQAVQTANNLIIAHAIENGLNVRVRTAPPVLSEEEVQQMIEMDSANVDANFIQMSIADQTILINQTLKSTWGGTVKFKVNENFANVIGSTGDPTIGGKSWLQLWTIQFGTPTCCTSLNTRGFVCGTYLVGGHIITGTKASVVPVGSNSVYIMPICAGHNSNDSIYMSAVIYQDGIWLNNYQQ